MSLQREITEVVSSIETMLENGNFNNYINYIRFPFFKNLEENSRINFLFPFTVLTGLNGSGKSSTLHALYGVPHGNSTGQYWFSTELDPIRNEKGLPPSFIYGYNNEAGNNIEVLKTRVGTSKGADYWEPSRPIKRYNMEILPDGARNPAIRKNVIYLDFRAELSAFDKYFYFGNFRQRQTLATKQDVIRKYSKHIRSAIDNNNIKVVRSRSNQQPVVLSSNIIRDISFIRDKSYSECVVLNHNFYEMEGATIYFKTSDLNYSEAFAGRGEFAVVKLVNSIYNVPNNSLVILDEPEVSLHPSAQEKLKLFLLKKTREKQLQVVVSTHAQKFVEYLPDTAIKLFYQRNAGKFAIKNSCTYFEAFENIGIEVNDRDKKTILLEDVTAKAIVDAIIDNLGGDFSIRLATKFYPGGAQDIYKRSVSYAEEEEFNKFILLDGDQNRKKHDPSQFTAQQSGNMDFLTQMLCETTGMQFPSLGFKLDGGTQGGYDSQKRKAIISYMTYIFTNLAYMPLIIPEDIIWNDQFATSILSLTNKSMPQNITDSKSKFIDFTQLQFGSTEANLIEASQKMFIQEFIRREDTNYHEIVGILTRFINT